MTHADRSLAGGFRFSGGGHTACVDRRCIRRLCRPFWIFASLWNNDVHPEALRPRVVWCPGSISSSPVLRPPLPMPIAFKEWAVTVRALAEGEQLVTLRKGGIRDDRKHFELEHDPLFLYPTFAPPQN